MSNLTLQMCLERPKILETTLRSPKSDFRWLRSYQLKFWVNRRCRWSRVSRQNIICEALKQNQYDDVSIWCGIHVINPGPLLMTWHMARNFLLTWHSLTCLADWTDSVADDCAELLAWLMTWRVNPVQLLEFGRRRRVECVWRVGTRG